MRPTTELERQKTAVLKAMRAAIRLKHALAADDEIADVLPKLEAQIDQAIAAGAPLAISPGDIFIKVGF